MEGADKKLSFARSFVHGELHLGFWSFVKKSAGALDSFFILRSLTLYQFGVYQLLISFYGILSDFFHDVFGEVASNDIARFIGEGKEDRAKRLFFEYAFFRLVMAGIPCAALFFAVPLFSSRYGSEIAGWIGILSFLFLADAAVALMTLLLKLRLQFKILAPRATVQKLLQFLTLSFFYFFSHLGIREIFLSQIAGAVGVTLLLLPATVSSFAPWRRVKAYQSFLGIRIIQSYGKWEIPRSVLNDFTGKIRPWLIKLFLSTEAVGIFGIANMFISALKDFVPTRTPGALIPRRVRDPAALARFYRFGTKYYVWFALIICGGAAVGTPLAVWFLFPKFVSSLPLFYTMLIIVPIFAFVKPMTFFLVAFRRQKFLFGQTIVQNALWCVLFVVLVPMVGILGLGVAEVLTTAINSALRYRYLKKEGIIGSFAFRSLAVIEEDDRAHFALFMRHLRSSLRFG
ncbi:MAG: oligosaccharide flippase family protein [Candidatus Sungiibacteriota bacterium]